MKKVLLVAFASLLLFNCDHDDQVISKKETKVSNHEAETRGKTQLPNGTYLLTDAKASGSNPCNFTSHVTDYIIYNNNFWNCKRANAAQSQTMWVFSEDSWGVDISAAPHTDNDMVISYPSVIMGQHYNNKTAKGSFPMLVSNVGRLSANWAYTIHSGNKLNASFDIWVHTSSDHGTASAARYEIMIWPYRKAQQPIAARYDANGAVPIGTFTNQNREYNVYKGDNGAGSTVLTFIPKTGTTTATNTFTADLGNFIREAKKTKYGFITDKHYVTSVQAGYEILNGAKVETRDFDFSYN
jgi:hypothetical protein